MRKLLPLIILSVAVFNKAFCQNDSTGKAVIYFKQKNAIIYLDGKKITSEKKLRSLAVGKHVIKAWAPTYELFVDSFYTKQGMNEFYAKKLRHSEDYKSYRTKKLLRRTAFLPFALTIISAVSYNSKYKDFDKRLKYTRDYALSLEDTYRHSFTPGEFQDNYDNYYAKKEEYDKLQKQQKNLKIQGIVVTSALAATTITFFIINKLKPKITYKETPLLARFLPAYDPFTNQLCLTIKL